MKFCVDTKDRRAEDSHLAIFSISKTSVRLQTQNSMDIVENPLFENDVNLGLRFFSRMCLNWREVLS